MPPHDHALDVAKTWCRLIGAATRTRLDDLLTEESVVHGLTRVPLRGIEAIQRGADEFTRIYPGKTCQLLDGMMQDDHAAVRWTITFSPKAWHIEGMPTEFEGITMCTVREGRIVELHTRFARWWV
jgi:hypothetical protein